MSAHPAIRSVLLVGITLLVALVVLVLIQAPQATDLGMLILYQGFGALVGFGSIATVLWAVFVVIGSIRLRSRSRRRRILWFIASAALCAAINAGVIAALSLPADGWGGLITAIGVSTALIFTVSAAAATLLVEFVILRRRGERAPSVAL